MKTIDKEACTAKMHWYYFDTELGRMMSASPAMTPEGTKCACGERVA